MNNIRVRVITKGKSLKIALADIKEIVEKDKKKLRNLAPEVQMKIQSIIKENKKRPGGNEELEKSINIEYFLDGWGIGNINLLPPYWAAVNWGSEHMVDKHLPVGSFSPGNPKPNPSDFRQGRWKQSSKGYSPKVKNPIPPMNYIEKTLNWFRIRINQIIKGK